MGLLRRRETTISLGTGSPELDFLTGNLEPGLFYLFYGDEDDGLPDTVLHWLLVEAVAQGGRAIYVVCGNYRRSRTMMDSEFLLNLIDEAGLDIDDSLSRIHIIFAFSEHHLIRMPSLVEKILEKYECSLVALQQLPKLFHGEDAIHFKELTEFTGIVSRLKESCSESMTTLVATSRPTGRGRSIPEPEGGSYLKHAANAILFLRESGRGSVSAYVVKHPDRARMGRVVNFGGGGTLWDG
jgi:hypothetical protein